MGLYTNHFTKKRKKYNNILPFVQPKTPGKHPLPQIVEILLYAMSCHQIIQLVGETVLYKLCNERKQILPIEGEKKEYSVYC